MPIDKSMMILPLTPEQELNSYRASMPPLTSRQFWLAAYEIGVTKESVKALCADDPTLMIVVDESSTLVRTDQDIITLSLAMGITPDQLDNLWEWAATK